MMQSIAIFFKIYFYYTIIILHDRIEHVSSDHQLQHIPLQRLNLNALNETISEERNVNNNNDSLVYGNFSNNGTSQNFNNYKHTVMNQNHMSYENVNLVNDVISAYSNNRRTNSTGSRIDGAAAAVGDGIYSDGTAFSRKFKRDAATENVCNKDCYCDENAKFLAVHCKFSGKKTLKPPKYVPSSATSMFMALEPYADVLISANFFQNNHLNRIVIEGSNLHSEQVEIGSFALAGNTAPFPEIVLVNLDSVIIRSHAFKGEFELNITNCRKVLIFDEAFENTSFNGNFENISDLELRDRALAKSKFPNVLIKSCHLEELKRLEIMRQIQFIDSHIKEIVENAFDVVQIYSIIFRNCKIDNIEKNAFTGKLFVESLEITKCDIGNIETEAISGSGITSVTLRDNKIHSINTKAITLTANSLMIQNNTINSLEAYWMRVEDGWTKVLVSNNRFGEYHQMTIEYTKNPIQCLFEDNSITKAHKDSLNLKSPQCSARQISFKIPCSCDPSHFKMLSYNDIRSESFCTTDDTLTHCFNASLFNVKSYEEDFCGSAKEIDCFKSRVNAKKNTSFIDLLGNNPNKLLYVYIIVGCLLLLLLLLLLFVLVRCCCRRCHSKNVEESANRDIMIMESLHRPSMFRQRSSSFSQSDITIIEKTIQLMRIKYPPVIYDQVHNNTIKLVEGNLSEAEKVSTIGEIVRSLGECEEPGTDFVEFTDILYMHLGPETDRGQREHDPIYFEPNAPPADDDDDNRYAGHNIDVDRAGVVGNGVVAGEHIYAEPMNLQQPLLPSEYNVPVDRKSSISHVYTEPISRAIDTSPSSHPYPSSSSSLTASRNKQQSNGALPSSSIYAKYAIPSKKQNKPDTKLLNIDNSPPTPLIPPAAPTTSLAPLTSSAPLTVTNLLNATYAKPIVPKISDLGSAFKTSAHSSSTSSQESHLDHSGASGATLIMDESIKFADA